MNARWLSLSLVAVAVVPRFALAQAQAADASASTSTSVDAGAPPPPPPPPATTQAAAPPPPPPPAQPKAADTTVVQVTSLKILRDKHIISQDEYDSALRDIGSTAGTKGLTDTNTLVVGKFATTIYGFVEADAIHDSTEGLSDLQGNSQIARNETFGGQHGQLLGTIRNSRLGFRIQAPEFHGIRASGQFEMDFLGNQPAVGYPPGTGVSEASYFANAGFRERHINVKVETPVLDFLFGQYWALFGWQPYFHPNTVDFQGVPAEIYSRRPQFRISKTLRTDPLNVDIAVAALNPVQRASEAPEMQGGVRATLNHWKGKRTDGSTGTTVEPASIGVSGDLKYVRLPTFPDATSTVDKVGTSIAFDAFLPVLPANDGGKSGNDLSITGEFATGYGTADQYSGFTGGVGFPTPPNPTGANPAPTYPQNIDNGIVSFDSADQLHFVQWYTGFVGLQYYWPIKGGKVWTTVNYSHAESPNATSLGSLAKTRASIDWFNVDLFADPFPGFRLGLSYGRTWDHYGDKQEAVNDRVIGSAFFIF